MAASANAMVHDAIEAFINQDLDSAMEIINGMTRWIHCSISEGRRDSSA